MPLKRRSKIRYGSLLIYAIGDKLVNDAIQLSHDVTASIKNDSRLFEDELGPDYLARVFLDRCEGTSLGGFVPPDAILVPIPRSSPLKEHSSWPALRIAEALLAAGIGERVEPLLERIEATRSSSRDHGERLPERHYATSSARPLDLFADCPVVLVDDVIASGATALGMAWRLDDVIGRRDLRVLAIAQVKTVGDASFDLLSPTVGEIRFDPESGKASRVP